MRLVRLRRARLYVDPRDCWVGVFWRIDSWGVWRELTVYLCLLPCLPLKLVWRLP